MSKWREIVEAELNRVGLSLYESSTIKFSIDELANTLLYFDAVDTGLRYLYVYKNPSSIEIDNILQNCKEKELRGLAIDNDFYIWDAYFCIHIEMLNLLKERIYIDTNSYIGDFAYDGQLEAGYIQKGNDNYIKDIDLLKKILLNNKHFLHTFGENKIYNMSSHQDWELEDLDLNEGAKEDRADYLYLHDCFNAYIEGLENKLEPHRLYCNSDDLSINMETNFGNITIYLALTPDNNNFAVGIYRTHYDGISSITLNLYKIADLTKLGYVEEFNTDPYTGEENVPFLYGQTIVELAHKMQSVFFHEFTHFIDDKERKRFKNKSHQYNKDSDKLYYNQPHELNAYYMEILNNISIKLFKKYHKNLSKMTPEERLDFIKNEWSKDEEFMEYYNKLELKAKKRLLSRLYSYFNTNHWQKA